MGQQTEGATPSRNGRLLLPRGLPGINEFASAQWWDRHAAELGRRGIRRRTEQGPVAADVLEWTGNQPSWGADDRRVLMLSPLLDVVRSSGVTQEAAVDTWADRVITAASACPGSVVQAVTSTGSDVLLDTVLAAAAGQRWPLPDTAQTPSGFPDAGRFTACFDRITRDAGDSKTICLVRHDVLASLDAAYSSSEAPADDAQRLRARSITALERIRAAGVHVFGPEEHLLWPARPEDAGIHVETVKRSLVAAFRGVYEWCDLPADSPDPEILRQRERLDHFEETLKEQRRRARLIEPGGLSKLGGRRLLRMLTTPRSRW